MWKSNSTMEGTSASDRQADRGARGGGSQDASASGSRELVALIPQKLVARAKTRLAGVLDEQARQQITLELLRRTLAACERTEGVSALFVSGEPDLAPLVAGYGAHLIPGGAEGMRQDIAACSADICLPTHAALLIVSADLPLMEPGDLDAVISAWREGADVVLAPDRRRRGTNVMLVHAPERFEYAFGEVVGRGSFHTHRSHAEGLGLRVAVVESPRLALDLDLPVDMIAFIREAPDDPLARFCQERARELPYFG